MTDDEIEDVIHALSTHYMQDLTLWERDTFLPSISEQYDQRGTLSARQKEVLDVIWNRVTQGGTRPGRGGI